MRALRGIYISTCYTNLSLTAVAYDKSYALLPSPLLVHFNKRNFITSNERVLSLFTMLSAMSSQRGFFLHVSSTVKINYVNISRDCFENCTWWPAYQCILTFLHRSDCSVSLYVLSRYLHEYDNLILTTGGDLHVGDN